MPKLASEITDRPVRLEPGEDLTAFLALCRIERELIVAGGVPLTVTAPAPIPVGTP